MTLTEWAAHVNGRNGAVPKLETPNLMFPSTWASYGKNCYRKNCSHRDSHGDPLDEARWRCIHQPSPLHAYLLICPCD